MAQKQKLQDNEREGEIMLGISLDVDKLVKNPQDLYLAIAMSKYVDINDRGYHLFFKSEDVSYIVFSSTETPYFIIHFENGKVEEIGWGDDGNNTNSNSNNESQEEEEGE